MIKHGEPNPLNVFGLRRLNHCPPHFFKITVTQPFYEKKITDWIYEKLEGRFYYGIGFAAQHEIPGIIVSTIAAFEVHSEATYFSLYLPSLIKVDNSLF